MSDSDEGLGALFAGDEAVQGVMHESETLMQLPPVDRLAIALEGHTYDDFALRYDGFDLPCTAEEDMNAVLAQRRARLTALRPAPLQVFYGSQRHSLWGHMLWNAAKYLVKRMDERLIDVRGKTVLELGAGVGVPSLVAYRNGARLVVVTDYPDEVLLRPLRHSVEVNCRPGCIDGDVCTPEQQSTASTTANISSTPRCVVEPLLWGNEAQLQRIIDLSPSRAGFDLVFLSDILFNHVCNDDLANTLARTLQRSPTAAAYCVFSHHRAHKQLQDFEFFDKCAARGLRCELVDMQDYPLMFAEDKGPVAVRQPVKCYRIAFRHDAAGLPLELNASCVDVLVQGTGLVQAFLSAALARSGLRVLHCDAQPHYGGVFHSLPLCEMTSYLTTQAGVMRRLHWSDAELPLVLCDHTARLVPELRTQRRFLVDLLPCSYMAKGRTIDQLVRSDMARYVEFQNLSCFAFLSVTNNSDSKVCLHAVPLTRAAVFATDAISLLDKRRMMKFVKDVEASLAELHHARSANPADDPNYDITASRGAIHGKSEEENNACDDGNKEEEDDKDEYVLSEAMQAIARADPALSLSQLLRDRYHLSRAAVDLVTLMHRLEDNDNNNKNNNNGREEGKAHVLPLAASLALTRRLWHSIGLYGGGTPFLLPLYGAAELPQSLCRTSAVWGGSFVLRRGVSHIVLDPAQERQYAVLSNGQHIAARVIVAPGETATALLLPARHGDWQSVWRVEQERQSGLLAQRQRARLAHVLQQQQEQDKKEKDTRLSRVVLATRRPLFTWAALRGHHGLLDVSAEEQSNNGEDNEAYPPLLMALTRITSTNAGEEEEEGVVVHIAQHSATSEQAPAGHGAVVHFTCDAQAMSHRELLRWVVPRFCRRVPALAELSLHSTSTQEVTGAPSDPSCSSSSSSSDVQPLDYDEDVIYCASFVLSGTLTALQMQCVLAEQPDGSLAIEGDIASETRHTDAYALQECARLQRVTEGRKESEAAVMRSLGTTQETNNTDEEDDDIDDEQLGLSLVTVPTLRASLLDDGAYVRAAERAYAEVIRRVVPAGPEGGRQKGEKGHTYTFLERLPPPPAVTSSN